MQLFSKVARSDARQTGMKTELNAKQPFNVMHFGITEKPTTDCVSLYNDAVLIPKVSKEIANKNAENCRC